MFRTPPENIEKEKDVEEGRDIPKGEKETMEACFRSGRKIPRSPALVETATPPAMAPSAADTPARVPQKTSEYVTTVVNIEAQETRGDDMPIQVDETAVQTQGVSSPRLELIYKLRSLEEGGVNQCKVILRKIRLALQRQRNVSNDIKEGVSQLEEQLDVIERYRKSWKSAEEERNTTSLRVREEINGVSDSETPLSRSKRIATSPAEETPATGKRIREKEPSSWQVVERRRGKKLAPEKEQKSEKPSVEKNSSSAKEKPNANGRANAEKGNPSNKKNRIERLKPQAILIKPTEGNSYADVLRSLRTKMRPNEAAKVNGIRKTRAGALLLELSKGEKVQAQFVEDLKSTVQKAATVSELKPMSTVEIRDLDSFTERSEVEEALKSLLDRKDEELRISMTAPNNREQLRAFVTLSSESAATLLKLERVKIGWIRAKIRPCMTAGRCFRCLKMGHFRFECKGPDRSNLCYRCGEPGHKVKDCAKPAKCCLCVEAGRSSVDHFPTSKRCPEYKTIEA